MITKALEMDVYFHRGPAFGEHMIPVSAEFMDMVTGHGLTGSCLHRFKIIPNSTCPCGLKDETDS